MRRAEPTCRDVVELVTAYLEGALTRGERSRFEGHLAGCPGCRRYLRQIEDTLRAAGRLSQRSIPREARRGLVRAFRDWRSGRSV